MTRIAAARVPRAASRRRAFTILELVVVIVVMSILVAAGMFAYTQVRSSATDLAGKPVLGVAQSEARKVAADHGYSYPTSPVLLQRLWQREPATVAAGGQSKVAYTAGPSYAPNSAKNATGTFQVSTATNGVNVAAFAVETSVQGSMGHCWTMVDDTEATSGDATQWGFSTNVPVGKCVAATVVACPTLATGSTDHPSNPGDLSSCPTTPTTPSGGTQQPPTCVVVTPPTPVNPTTATVKWNAPTDTTKLASYRVLVYNGPVDLNTVDESSAAFLVSAAASATSATVTGLAPGVAYTFAVEAVSTTGQATTVHDIVTAQSVLPIAVPASNPVGSLVASMNHDLQKLTLTFTGSAGAESYQVFRRDAGTTNPWQQMTTIAPTAANTSYTWTDTSVTRGRAYTYRVDNVVTPTSQEICGLTSTSGSGNSAQATSKLVNVSDSFSGSGNLGATEVGGLSWLFPSAATFSRNGGSAVTGTSLASNPMAVVDAGITNIDAQVPVATGGEALYFRVADQNNWLRVRARRTDTTTSYQYYNTEYQHNTYTTEYQYQTYQTWNHYQRTHSESQYQDYQVWNTYAPMQYYVQSYYRTYAWHIEYWRAWIQGTSTSCGTQFAGQSPALTDGAVQIQWRNDGGKCGTNGSQVLYVKYTRTGRVNNDYVWLISTDTCPRPSEADQAYTCYKESPEQVKLNAGSQYYWADCSATSCFQNQIDQYTGTSQEKPMNAWYGAPSPNLSTDVLKGTGSRALGTYYWSSTGKKQSIDQPTGSTRQVVDADYYAGTPAQAGDTLVSSGTAPVSPATYYWSSSGPNQSMDQYTGSTRQVVSGSYWDQNACGGCPTRQVGPYTGYTTTSTYDVVTDKSVGGAVAPLSSVSVASLPSSLRVVTDGPTVKVYGGATLLATLSESQFVGATQHGVGLAGPTAASPPGIDNFTLTTAP